jgi:hypothetical protein
MTSEETHVILAARNVYNACRKGDHTKSALSKPLVELAKACANLELAERIAKNTPRRSVVLRLVK